MFNAFEQRLADLLSDAIGGAPSVESVLRAGAVTSNPPSNAAVVTVQVLSAKPREEVGDDRREVRRNAGAFELRTVLRMQGEVLINLGVASAANATAAAAQRGALVDALDELLVALQAENVRSGAEFELDGEDQGFELDSFQLDRFEVQSDTPDDVRAFRVIYRFSGLFWPVEPALSGPKIVGIPRRIAVLPARFPRSVRARPGAGDVRVPIELDLRATGDARPTLVARLLGSAPPGSLIGDAAGLPAGSIGYSPAAAGNFEVVYRPPQAIAGKTRVRVALGLSSAQHGTVEIGELAIEVGE